MARLARVQYEGAIYHVTVRGNNRRDIFVDDRDRQRFMDRLADGLLDFEVRLYSFCLMRNHVHLVVETPRGNLGAFMHKLQTAYTVYFNKRHRLSGHLMQGRYGAKVVEGDDYLLALARYVHLNPVFVGAVARQPLEERARVLRAYPWSSYQAYLGQGAWDFVQTGPLLAMMDGRSQARRRLAFRRFVEAAMAEGDEEFLAVYRGSRLGIGGESFLAGLGTLYEATAAKSWKAEDIAFRRVARRLDKERIMAVVRRHLGVETGEEQRRRRGSWLRAVGARMLHRFGGLTQREIAAIFGMRAGKSVSDQLRRLSAEVVTDKALRRLVDELERDLEREQKALKL